VLLDSEPDPLPFLPRLPDPVRPESPHAATIGATNTATIGRIGTFAPPIVPRLPAVERPKRRARVALIVLFGLALGGVGFYFVKARGSASADPAVAPTVSAQNAAELVPIESASFSFALPSRPVAEERPRSADEDNPTKIWTVQITGGTLQVLAFASSTPLDARLTQSKVDRVVSRLAQMSGANVLVNEPDPVISPSARRVIMETPTSRVFIEVLNTPDWIVFVSQGGANHEITPVYASVLASFTFR
jgi:hypothetical protein